MTDTFQSHGTLEVDGKTYRIARLKALEAKGHDLSKLPFATKILLENLLRREDGKAVTTDDIEALASWKPNSGKSQEIAFNPVGQVVGMMNEVQSSRELIEDMVTGYLDTIEHLNALQARAEG